MLITPQFICSTLTVRLVSNLASLQMSKRHAKQNSGFPSTQSQLRKKHAKNPTLPPVHPHLLKHDTTPNCSS